MPPLFLGNYDPGTYDYIDGNFGVPNALLNTSYGVTIQGQPAADESMPPQQLQLNESYNYNTSETVDSVSNTIEAKENEAYAMNITTEKNEAYKPVAVVSVSASRTSDEYDYIYLDELHACLL